MAAKSQASAKKPSSKGSSAEKSATKKSSAAKPGGGGIPTKAQILEFVQSTDQIVGKREIAKAFNVKGADRTELRRLLREMQDDGLLTKGHKGKVRNPGALPPVTVVEFTGQDLDGELLAKPVPWEEDHPPPTIVLAPGTGRGGKTAAVGIGDRALVRLTRGSEADMYEARVIKKLGASGQTVIGVYERSSRGKKSEGTVKPVDRKARTDYLVLPDDAGDAKPGDVVEVEILQSRQFGAKRARVVKRICAFSDPRAISLIAIHAQGIPTQFPQEALDEAEAAKPVSLGKREDLRDLPLVTIDPSDARDHDDAVHAEPDPDPKNPGGWIVTVAIADVAAYVRPGGALDKEARTRGNSVYLPDRVVPMLPEHLSTGLCSLKENEDRACLAVRMIFSGEGRKISHKFMRALMRSHARLSYEQVQSAVDGEPDKATKPLLDTVLKPLYAAFKVLCLARDKRQPLDLDLPEYRVQLDDNGTIVSIDSRERLDAHRLIEECMILANVCAAETLERRRLPLLYRIHDAPSREKLESLQEFLTTIGLNLAKGQTMKPMHFNKILHNAKGSEAEHMISEVILRSQSQACYSTENLGHFGLNLRRYAHFTSPIRRYADLTVHRALVTATKSGPDGQTDWEAEQLEKIGEEISGHERRAMTAERDATDRYMASYMENRLGSTFTGRISGVTRFGLFVKLDGSGADGFIPISTLGRERFYHEDTQHALIGEDSGALFRLGETVEVRLVETAPVTGGLRFELLSDPAQYVDSPRRGRGRDQRGPKGHGRPKRQGRKR